MHRTYKDELPSGLRLVTVEAPRLHSAMLAVYVRVGSRHESAANNGVSHFLEHLLFRGCERFPDGRRMNMRVEDAGGSLNGMTARDHGYYFTPLHPDHMEVGVETLGAMLARPLLKELEIEREVILEEMLDELDDDGRDVDIDNISKATLFAGHPLSLKIAGTQDSVRAIDLPALRAHHEQYYVARNLVLVAAGPVRHAQLCELAERHLTVLPTGEASREAPPPPWPSGPALTFVRHDDSQAELRLSFPAVPEWHPDYPALLVMRRVLDDGLSSRLQVNVVDRRGLAYSVQAGLDTYADAALFEVDAACAPAKVADTCAELLHTLGELADQPIPEDELRRAQVRFRIGFDFMRDSASDLAGWYGGTELFREAPGFDERMAAVEAVTAADVQRVARGLLRREHLQAFVVGKVDKATLRRLDQVVMQASGLPS